MSPDSICPSGQRRPPLSLRQGQRGTSLTCRSTKPFPCLGLAGICPHILAVFRVVQGHNKEICGSNSDPGAYSALSYTRRGISHHHTLTWASQQIQVSLWRVEFQHELCLVANLSVVFFQQEFSFQHSPVLPQPSTKYMAWHGTMEWMPCLWYTVTLNYETLLTGKIRIGHTQMTS